MSQVITFTQTTEFKNLGPLVAFTANLGTGSIVIRKTLTTGNVDTPVTTSGLYTLETSAQSFTVVVTGDASFSIG